MTSMTSPPEASASFLSREGLVGYQKELLRDARVAVVGVGALGQNVLITLALSGVRNVVLVDGDTFEGHNATRSPFFRADTRKVEAVAAGFLQLSTAHDPRVWVHDGLVQEVADLVISWAQVVVSAVDSDETRAFLAEHARLQGKPLIEAGFDGLDLSLSAFTNASAAEPCWRCGRRDVRDTGEKGLCTLYAMRVEAAEAIPATQSVAQVSGGLVAEAAIAALHGEAPLAGRRLYLNLRTGRSTLARLPLDPRCPQRHAPLAQIEPLSLAELDPTLGQVVEAIQVLERGASLQLLHLVVGRLPCRLCGHPLLVGEPLWRLRQAPSCPGGCPAAPAAGPPELFSEVGSDQESLLSLPARQVGLGPGALVKALHLSGEERYVRLPGEVERRLKLHTRSLART